MSCLLHINEYVEKGVWEDCTKDDIRLEKMEVGYLAMHIERVYLDTLGAQNEE